jgi:hypothetical protein
MQKSHGSIEEKMNRKKTAIPEPKNNRPTEEEEAQLSANKPMAANKQDRQNKKRSEGAHGQLRGSNMTK